MGTNPYPYPLPRHRGAGRDPGKQGFVYILASQKNCTLYIGVTSNLENRIYQHQQKLLPGFTKKYDVTRLVWFQAYDSIISAIEEEKQLKEWQRKWKIRLIEEKNPRWLDLSSEFVGLDPGPRSYRLRDDGGKHPG